MGQVSSLLLRCMRLRVRAYCLPPPQGPIPPAADFYWVDPDTVPGYITQQRTLMKNLWGSVPPALVFVHIPLQKSDILAPLPSLGNHDDEPDPAVQGYLGDTYTGKDLPFWRALKDLSGGKKGRVLAIVSGWV